MGSRSKSEIIAPFNIDGICRNRPRQYNSIGRIYHELNNIISEARAINNRLTGKSIFMDEDPSVGLFYDGILKVLD